MSHYAVVVFSNLPEDAEFDRLLAPYDENGFEKRFVIEENELVKKYKDFLLLNPNWKKLGFEYYLKEHGYKREGNEIVAYYNPDAKWDYYVLDGRDGLYDLKPGVETDCLFHRKKDFVYDDEDEKDSIESAKEFWQKYVVDPAHECVRPFELYSWNYYLERYKTLEQYIKEIRFNGPYAFITPDGVWHAPGEVGYFAMSSETAESMNRYMDEWNEYISSEDNPYVSFVDCHI